jgi:hypothetical protein
LTPPESLSARAPSPLRGATSTVPRDAPWLSALKRELLAFPNGKYDDQVDSLVQFLDWTGSRRGRGFLDRDPRTGRPLGYYHRSAGSA